jgi:hypothetical protein
MPFPFDVVMADKKANSAGLQLADLVAPPYGSIFPDRRRRIEPSAF